MPETPPTDADPGEDPADTTADESTAAPEPAQPAEGEAEGAAASAPDSTRLVLGFTWRFLLAVAALSTLVYVDEALLGGAAIYKLTSFIAGAVAATLSFAGFATVAYGNELTYDDHVFKIITECVGIEVLELYAAAVVAFPVPWKDRLRGLATGLPILFFVNFIRMITLVFIGAQSDRALEIGHLYVWPLVVIALAIGLWLSWAWSTTDETSPTP